MNTLTLHPAAKVNLSLRVMGRRSNGFHNVETILHTVGIRDTVQLTAREAGIELRVTGEQVPADASNLCWRAAELLAAQMKVTRGAGIVLHKGIPVGAGLGGASSDAAAVLTGLARLWEVAPGPETMDRLAAEIGSDVPFFLRGGCCLALGRGERLERLPPAALSLVVVAPERRMPTAQAYAALRRGASLAPRKSLSRATQRMLQAVKSGGAAGIAKALHNDFEALEMVGIAEALEAKAALLEAGCLGALLSGSGSAVFGLAPDARAAESIAEQMRARWGWVTPVPTVTAEESVVVEEQSPC